MGSSSYRALLQSIPEVPIRKATYGVEGKSNRTNDETQNSGILKQSKRQPHRHQKNSGELKKIPLIRIKPGSRLALGVELRLINIRSRTFAVRFSHSSSCLFAICKFFLATMQLINCL